MPTGTAGVSGIAAEVQAMPLGGGNCDDGPQTAVQLEKKNPGWMIIYGSFSREYVAFPLYYEAPQRGYIVARDPGELARRMHEAEQRHGRSR